MQIGIPLIELSTLWKRLPPSAIFSGRTAAWLHGLDLSPSDPIEVTLPRLSRTSRLAKISLVRSDVAVSEMTWLHDLPVTTATRTIADLGRRLPLVDAVIALDMALHRRITRLEQLQQWVDSHAGFPGIRRLRRALELADGGAASPMETRLRLLLVLHGLPRPVTQRPLHDSTGMFVARPDLYYPRDRLALEYDGGTHRDSFAADNRRQNRLLEAGYRLLRFSASDIFRTPASVVGQVQRALRYSIIGSPN